MTSDDSTLDSIPKNSKEKSIVDPLFLSSPDLAQEAEQLLGIWMHCKGTRERVHSVVAVGTEKPILRAESSATNIDPWLQERCGYMITRARISGRLVTLNILSRAS